MSASTASPAARSRRLTGPEKALVVLEFGLGIGGLYGGIGLFARPDGSLIQLDPAVLECSPFSDFRLPGAVLVMANGILPLTAAVATLARRPWSAMGHLVVGAVTTGWIAVQLLLLGYIFFLQPLVLVWGLVISALAVVNRRRLGRRA